MFLQHGKHAWVSVTKTSRLLLFNEIIVAHSENHDTNTYIN
jgi:hypothetical protein